MTTTFIYVLKEPDTGEIRYVGKTDDAKKRLRTHIASRTRRCHRVCWIQSLVKRGLGPILEIIDEVLVTEWQAWEAAYIQFFLEEGCDLVNSTLGGEGITMTLEIRKKIGAAQRGDKNHMFGKKQSFDTIQKRTEKLIGKKRSPETCEKIGLAHRGKLVSELTKQKSSLSHLGKPGFWKGKKLSSEHRQKLSDSHKGPRM